MVQRAMVCLAVVACVSGAANGYAQSSKAAAPLPPAVKKAIEQETGRRRIVLYDAKGKVVEVQEEVVEKELPKPVADAMHSHPRAIFVSGMKVTRGGNVEYRLTVRGTRKMAMVARPDGTVLSFK